MKSSTERAREYRQRQYDMGFTSYRSRDKTLIPFIGCDGEGAGLDDLGRQNFLLFRIGDAELYTGKPLSTAECLEHICNSPNNKQAILTGFAFGYDTTMILKDLNSERRDHLFRAKERGQGKSPYTYYKNYGIDYLPRQYLRVCRIRSFNGAISVIPNTSRTIYECFGFFQTSFLKALKQFDIGSEHLATIEKNKAARSDFETMTKEIREYNRIECELLAELMAKLRDYCYQANIKPHTWSGAGKLAAALHRREKTITRKQVETALPIELITMAGEAYYGGRFEITRTGKLYNPIWEYDIRSAYPAAMAELPCLLHGRWVRANRKDFSRSSLHIANVQFQSASTPIYGQLGGLPIRSKQGSLYWPMCGNGIYWSCEIESAKRLGFQIKYRGGYVYHRECSCSSFSWVRDLYNYRKSIGSAGAGYPIKLGINSLYGKLAQRIGGAPYHNMVWAGLITAITRSKLNDAIALNPTGIVMIATDGIYSDKPLDLDIGDELGQWEETKLDKGMFIVQPGLYWGAKKPKVRGLPLKYFEEGNRTQQFEDKWQQWLEHEGSALRWSSLFGLPSVSVSVQAFIGLKLAQSRGKPDTAGQWVDQKKEISFDWYNKRDAYKIQDKHVITMPKPGSKRLVSVPHYDLIANGTISELDQLRNELSDNPDYIDLGIPWKDK
jgi:hypothetical protein